MDRCRIYDNSGSGVAVSLSSPAILNCVIHNNGGDGVHLEEADGTIIRNDTIVYNSGFGVNRVYGSNPSVANCILWKNNNNGVQYYGCSPTYSCYDPNDPNDATDVPDPTYHNITADPNFISAENYNYHLAYDSPCKNKGKTDLVIPGELDMDGFNRIDDTIVDMGADEVDCEDVYNPLDWNADGLVNMLELARFSAAWLSADPNNDPNRSENWDPTCDLDEDLDVDIDDLVLLCYEWLWRACWLDPNDLPMAMMLAPGGGETMSFSAASLSASASSAKTAPAAESIPLATLEDIVAFLEDIYNDNEEFQLGYSPQEWQEFIDEVKATWDDSW